MWVGFEAPSYRMLILTSLSLTDLVWSTISSSLSNLSRIFWEQPEEVRQDFDAFRRVSLCPYLFQNDNAHAFRLVVSL